MSYISQLQHALSEASLNFPKYGHLQVGIDYRLLGFLADEAAFSASFRLYGFELMIL